MLPSPPSPRALRVLFVTPEMHPLVKTGGLGDVSGALPGALLAEDVDVRVLIPGYPRVLEALPARTPVLELDALAEFPPAKLTSARAPGGVPLLVLECPELYERDGGPYLGPDGRDWPDNALRFGLLCRCAALLGSGGNPLAWRPHVVHCHDWQAGLTAAYLALEPEHARCVFTVHNLAFPGIFTADWVARLGLPPSAYGIDGVEYFGHMSFLKAGLFYADRITTVSPTYAQEIQRAPLGFGMQGLLAGRTAQVSGILNGIDTATWDPEHDGALAAAYGLGTLGRKQQNKRALQQRMGLDVDPSLPLLGAVTRLTAQKGVDLILESAARLVALPAQIVLLGTGEADLEQAVRDAARMHRGRFAALVGFDEPLSHLIEAGSDLFLMPSRFEPCGLNQMYSQRYGTPPVVHATGGLSDSVTDFTPAGVEAGEATGFVFRVMAREAFLGIVERAVDVWRDPALWRRLQENGMRRDFSWKRSAQAYRSLYESLSA